MNSSINIYNYALILFTFSFIASLFAVIFRKKFEETIIFAILFCVFFLYWFALFDALLAGLIIFIAILILAIPLFLFVLIKNPTINLSYIFSSGFFIYQIMLICTYFIFKDYFLYAWDDLSHWGLTAKDMFLENKIIPRTYADYPIATRLFQYFILNIHSTYSEGLLLSYFYFIYFAITIYPLKDCKIKQDFLGIILYTSIIILLPTCFIFFEDFPPFKIFRFLMVDLLLGFLFGYGIFLIWTKKHITLFDILTIALLLFTLVSVKIVGFLLSLFLILMIIIHKKEKNYLILAILGALSAKISWAIYISKNNYSSYLSNRLLNKITDLINGNYKIQSFSMDFINQYFRALWEKKLFLFLSYTDMLLLLTVLTLGLSIVYKKFQSKILYTYMLFILLLVIYTIGNIIIYLDVFHISELQRLSSFERYLNVLFSGIILFLLLICYTNYLDKLRKIKFLTIPCNICFIYLIFWVYYKDLQITSALKVNRLEIHEVKNTLIDKPYLDNNTIFFGSLINLIIFQYETGYNFHRITSDKQAEYIFVYKYNDIKKEINNYKLINNVRFNKLQDNGIYRIIISPRKKYLDFIENIAIK